MNGKDHNLTFKLNAREKRSATYWFEESKASYSKGELTLEQLIDKAEWLLGMVEESYAENGKVGGHFPFTYEAQKMVLDWATSQLA